MTSEAPEAQADEKTVRGRQLYDHGATTITALAADPRFSYCMYVPPEVTAETELVVAMHGTGRAFVDYRNGFAEFGRWNNCIILAPLFPVGVLGDGNRDGFKYIAEGDIRYDHVLLEMVKEVELKYGKTFPQFALFGYSGGRHFANRFLILHPERLWAVTIGAPGSVTLPDPTRNWWVGVADVEDRFGVTFRPEEMAKVAVQLVVGGADVETWEITHKPGGRHWMEGANDAGRTRPERSKTLQEALQAAGVEARYDLLPGLTHDGMKVLDTVKSFFAEVLQRRRTG